MALGLVLLLQQTLLLGHLTGHDHRGSVAGRSHGRIEHRHGHGHRHGHAHVGGHAHGIEHGHGPDRGSPPHSALDHLADLADSVFTAPATGQVALALPWQVTGTPGKPMPLALRPERETTGPRAPPPRGRAPTRAPPIRS